MRVAGVIIALIALIAAGLLFAGYENAKKRLADLERQMSSHQQQIASLESKLEQAHEDLRAQRAELESKLKESRESFAAQVAELEVQIEQTREEYLALGTELESQIASLRNNVVQPLKDRVANLETKTTYPLNVAYLNAEDAFSVFTDAVKDLRQKAVDKQAEIMQLQQQFMAGTISKEEYQNSSNQLQVELLQAQLNIDIGTIDRMIASPGFSDMHSDLQRLKEEAQPVVDEMKNLVSTVRMEVINPQEFQNRYTQVKNAFTQLDQLLTQAATSKIVMAAEKVAVENSYDLVLRSKNVIIYRNTAKLVDITDMVKTELAGYLW
jgi:chromosome segregation ATPase